MVPDVLIRDLDPATLSRLDAVAARSGQSRNALLRTILTEYAHRQPDGDLSSEEIEAFTTSTRLLLDQEQRAAAWRR
jgi:plasmid stability protein